jgi:hypothetical protein
MRVKNHKGKLIETKSRSLEELVTDHEVSVLNDTPMKCERCTSTKVGGRYRWVMDKYDDVHIREIYCCRLCLAEEALSK